MEKAEKEPQTLLENCKHLVQKSAPPEEVKKSPLWEGWKPLPLQLENSPPLETEESPRKETVPLLVTELPPRKTHRSSPEISDPRA